MGTMQHVNVGTIVVFINKVDVADAELLEANGFGAVPVVRGSALKALEAARAGLVPSAETRCIEELLEVLDRRVPVPKRDLEGPFLMPVEDVFTIGGRGTVVTGRVQRGVLRVNAEVEVLGGAGPWTTVVTDIEAFHESLAEARAGDNVGLPGRKASFFPGEI